MSAWLITNPAFYEFNDIPMLRLTFFQMFKVLIGFIVPVKKLSCLQFFSRPTINQNVGVEVESTKEATF